MSKAPIRVRIFYPADPVGVVPGGIDTFLRGLMKFAPDDLEFSLVGMSTDTQARPLGRWTRCPVGKRHFDIFPVVAQRDAGGRSRLPLSARYSAGLQMKMAAVHGGFDVFDFHRIEPSLLFTADARPKNHYFHNDPKMLRLSASDNLWKHAPGFYEGLERRALHDMASAWCVRETGVQALRERYPELAPRVRFIPTWVDPEVFSPATPAHRLALRLQQAHAQRLALDQPWLISVGRLDTQKDPLRTLDALLALREQGLRPHWLVVGDGVLGPELERRVQTLGLSDQVRFLGLLPPAEIADWLRGADVYVLSSAYEGMPMALLEAQACGLPAVVSDVGEVRRVVHPGINGAVVQGAGVAPLAQALREVLADVQRLSGEPAWAAVAPYTPADVLAPAFENYRRLGRSRRDVRVAATHARVAARGQAQPLVSVVGIPVQALSRQAVCERLLGWAREHQSRYVCFVNVHSSVHARSDEMHRQALLAADLAAPDGAPIAWTAGAKLGRRQPRVDGPGTMWLLCQQAAATGIKVGLYGSTAQTLQALQQALCRAMPKLDLAYIHSPPFRELSAAEDEAVCESIASSGVGLLFVGLGCPKQERWMAMHRGRIPAVMLGVGAAFDFHAGTAQRAPAWMRNSGLEWLHRLASQPRRLGPRYLHTNLLFGAKTLLESGRALLSETPQGAAAPGRAETQAQERRGQGRSLADLDPQLLDGLLTCVEAQLVPERSRLVGFIGTAGGVGTSTVAQAYASAAAAHSARRVLLLRTQPGSGLPLAGVKQALGQGRPLHSLTQPLAEGGVVAWLGVDDTPEAAQALLGDEGLWEALRSHFDDIVIDLPAVHGSALGLALARHCDGVVLVLGVAKSRRQVDRQGVAELRAVQAKLLGTVLNERTLAVNS